MTVAVIGEGDRIEALVSLLQKSGTEAVTTKVGHAAVTNGLDVVDATALNDIFLIFVQDDMTHLRETAFALGDHVSGRHAIVHLIHDLEPGSIETPSEVIECETATHRVGFLTGPMRASDVCENRPSSGLIASPFSEVKTLVTKCVVNPTFRVYTNDDLDGAEYVSAYVRIIAFAAGISHASNLGESVLATLFARGLAEASRFAQFFGGKPNTPHGLAGAANLFIDATAPGSADFQTGARVVLEGFDRAALEGSIETKSLLRLIDNVDATVRHLDGHILQMCAAITSGRATPKEAVAGLMSLPVLSE